MFVRMNSVGGVGQLFFFSCISCAWQPTDDCVVVMMEDDLSLPAPALLVLNPISCGARDAEEVRELLYAETGDVLVFLFVEGLFDQGALLVLQLDDAVFDRARDEHAVDFDWSDLANAVRTVNRLLLDVRIPEGIENDHTVGDIEVQTCIAGFQRHQHDAHVLASIFEVVDSVASHLGVHAAVITPVAPALALDRHFSKIK